MPKKQPPSGGTGPMRMQPAEHAPTASTQMLPTMPAARTEKKQETKSPAPEKKQTRAEAVRAAQARITRRDSLRKQRDAQKTDDA
jgi:hypothetical protein